MQSTAERQRKEISSHLSANEEIQAGWTGPSEVVVVTDSRVVSMEDKTEDGRSMRDIRSTSLTDGARGVEIQEFGSKAVDWVQAGFWCLALLVGILVSVLAFDSSGAQSRIMLLVGLIVIVSAGYLIYDTFDTPDGEIQVDVKTDAGTDTYWLPPSESDVAASVSEVVGKNRSR
ncbi:hypothetical protein [Halorussus halobius]|uniref:hypothetical protein n=1 Tax=Halorussus halobius TaxID=1710537 RepID=UPI0010926A11|nr:hypothetical protein [Halorussus halobius]